MISPDQPEVSAILAGEQTLGWQLMDDNLTITSDLLVKLGVASADMPQITLMKATANN